MRFYLCFVHVTNNKIGQHIFNFSFCLFFFNHKEKSSLRVIRAVDVLRYIFVVHFIIHFEGVHPVLDSVDLSPLSRLISS